MMRVNLNEIKERIRYIEELELQNKINLSEMNYEEIAKILHCKKVERSNINVLLLMCILDDGTMLLRMPSYLREPDNIEVEYNGKRYNFRLFYKGINEKWYICG